MTYQVAIIGGGFYGCATSLHLRERGYDQLTLIERELQLLTRASYRNQARVHNGYHYPRSHLTAYRSRMNLPQFCRDYHFAINTDFVMLYVIAGRRSKVIPRQFERFMRDIGAKYETAGSGYASLFERTNTAAVYVVEEYAFDACKLRKHFHRELSERNVALRLGTECVGITLSSDSGRLRLALKAADDRISHIEADTVVNCTYSRLNHVAPGNHAKTPLKHEIAELALVDVPASLSGLGVTVMDGPFFSCMPFPAEQCHSLSHVRYTPHCSFVDVNGSGDPPRDLDVSLLSSRADYMIADAARLMPCIRHARWRRSLFEVKTVLARNESDDGRPVLLRREALHPRLFSILGAKIDNVYDVLIQLDNAMDTAVPGKLKHTDRMATAVPYLSTRENARTRTPRSDH